MALLRCSVMSSIGGSQLVSLTITDGQSTSCAAPPADTRRVCACTFYLVFKEPEVIPLRHRPFLGEPYNLTKRQWLCQARCLSPRFTAGFRRGMVEPRRLAQKASGGPHRTHPLYDPQHSLSTSRGTL